MIESYEAMKQRHQKDINDFPMFFAFSNDQFDKGMKSLELNPGDTDKIYKLGNTGGYYRRDDAEKLHDMFDKQEKELREAIAADSTGEGFIFEMFNYELGNHEYVLTHNISDTLEALGLTAEEVNENGALLRGLKKAIKFQKRNNRSKK